MIIYIASSWKNQHAVVLLTQHLRQLGFTVKSFIENQADEIIHDFDDWVRTDAADKCFSFDTYWSTHCDALVYIAPSGPDAAAEVGAAWAKDIPILGLTAKGNSFGLMRKMIIWYSTVDDLTHALKLHSSSIKSNRESYTVFGKFNKWLSDNGWNIHGRQTWSRNTRILTTQQLFTEWKQSLHKKEKSSPKFRDWLKSEGYVDQGNGLAEKEGHHYEIYLLWKSFIGNK